MARQKDQFKAYRNKRRLRLLYLVLSFVLIVVALISGCVMFFRIEEIQVSGSTKYSNEQILSVADVDENANLLLLPEQTISQRVVSSLPYVNRVKLKRKLPTTLSIVIEECVPLAAIQGDGPWFILDENAKVLERVEGSIASGYIQISGLDLVEPVVGETAQVSEVDHMKLKGLCGLLTALHEKGVASQVQWIDLAGETKIEMGYMERFTVYLPISTDYNSAAHKNEEYMRVVGNVKQIEEMLDDTDRGIIDVRHENGYFRPR